MGFNVDLIAIRGADEVKLFSAMKLQMTSETESEPESEILYAALPSGWDLFFFNRSDLPHESVMATISREAEVLLLSVSETVMVSFAECLRDGKLAWAVSHDPNIREDHLETTGPLPACYKPIESRLKANQALSDGADHLFDVPVEVFYELTGFRYDGNPDGYPVESFRIMKSLAPRRAWWQFW